MASPLAALQGWLCWELARGWSAGRDRACRAGRSYRVDDELDSPHGRPALRLADRSRPAPICASRVVPRYELD
jgi:hypothetical protein